MGQGHSAERRTHSLSRTGSGRCSKRQPTNVVARCQSIVRQSKRETTRQRLEFEKVEKKTTRDLRKLCSGLAADAVTDDKVRALAETIASTRNTRKRLEKANHHLNVLTGDLKLERGALRVSGAANVSDKFQADMKDVGHVAELKVCVQTMADLLSKAKLIQQMPDLTANEETDGVTLVTGDEVLAEFHRPINDRARPADDASSTSRNVSNGASAHGLCSSPNEQISSLPDVQNQSLLVAQVEDDDYDQSH